jgi:hypothetical protein
MQHHPAGEEACWPKTPRTGTQVSSGSGQHGFLGWPSWLIGGLSPSRAWVLSITSASRSFPDSRQIIAAVWVNAAQSRRVPWA